MNEYVDKIKKLMEKEMVRYVIAGGMTTAVNLVSFFVLRLVTDLSRSAANIIAIMLAILFAYFANGFYVFRSEQRKRRPDHKGVHIICGHASVCHGGGGRWNQPAVRLLQIQ